MSFLSDLYAKLGKLKRISFFLACLQGSSCRLDLHKENPGCIASIPQSHTDGNVDQKKGENSCETPRHHKHLQKQNPVYIIKAGFQASCVQPDT